MRRLWKRPVCSILRGDADEDRAVALLCRAIVSGIDRMRKHAVIRILAGSRLCMISKTEEVRLPRFFSPQPNIGIGELTDNVLEVVSKCRSKQPPHVFED